MRNYDIAIIGAGPGGYVAALYAAQSGMRVCLIEKDALGGVCLNRGCIPTKTMIKSGRVFASVKEAGLYGVKTGEPLIDFASVRKRAEDVVGKLRNGVEYLLKARKVDVLKGVGCLSDAHTVTVGAESVHADHIIIATGSRNVDIAAARVDEKSILSSSGFLLLSSIPQEIIIIGGGVIGCEFASLYGRFGSRITIIEMLDRLLPAVDEEISRRMEAAFKKSGITVLTGTRVEGTRYGDAGRVMVALSGGTELACDKLLVSVGRQPITDGIALEKAGVLFDKKGIKVDAFCRTNVPNIFAIGDCIGGAMLAHAASRHAFVVVNAIAGKKQEPNSVMPYAIFTDPEVASCGLTETAVRQKGVDAKSAKFFFRALGKANAEGKTDGFVKIVFDGVSKQILGADIMGENASDLIAELTLAVTKKMTVDDVAETLHIHPTMSEAILEACHCAEGTPIHSL
ncbi:MAG: dihydrolipoyl dehydrogenase [Candidatus Omnitrophica bacterium]|nr:dihydrolipoyl dehydrogenase [Candidatus Omnitrophota bacterium]